MRPPSRTGCTRRIGELEEDAMMTIRRSVATALAIALFAGATPILAQQGLLAGKASDAGNRPQDHVVQLRDVTSGQILATTPLTPQREFSFGGLELTPRYQVELVNTRENRVVCTEGVFELSPTSMSKTDIDIKCRTPLGWWLLGAAAGITGAAALATQSSSS